MNYLLFLISNGNYRSYIKVTLCIMYNFNWETIYRSSPTNLFFLKAYKQYETKKKSTKELSYVPTTNIAAS